MDNIPPDIFRKIFQFLDDEEIDKICVSEKVCNDFFWIQRIMNKFGLTPEEISRNRGNDIRKYYNRLNMLTKEKFEAILTKPELASLKLGFNIKNAKDLYDLLYETRGDYDWGVVKYYNDDYIENETLTVLQDFFNFMDLKDVSDEDDLKSRREFLNEILAENHQEMIRNYFDELVDNRDELVDDRDELVDDRNFDQWLESLFTLETRLQNYIIDHTNRDVRKQIKDYQSNISDNLEDVIYNDEEIEALQILHEAIRDKKLSIFDPVDYDYIIRRV